MAKCAVSGCPNRAGSDFRGIRRMFKRPPKRFFRFPKDPSRVKVWLAALREPDRQDLSEQPLICEDHFLPEDITNDEVNSDAIPIMPPCLDTMGPWGAESSEEEEEEEVQWDAGGVEEGGGDDGPAITVHSPRLEPVAPAPFVPEPPAAAPPEQLQQRQPAPGSGFQRPGGVKPSPSKTKRPPESPRTSRSRRARQNVTVTEMTKRLLELMLASPDSTMDVRQLTSAQRSASRRICDITNVLQSIELLEKQSPHNYKWIGSCCISSFLWKNQQEFQADLDNLLLMEETLDGLIKSCSQQLFDITDDMENAALAYVTHQDIGRLSDFQGQTVMVVKAPEETQLLVSPPTQNSIQVHLKGKSPIGVLTSDMGADGTSGRFVPLDQSQIKTATLHTEQLPVQSA